MKKLIDLEDPFYAPVWVRIAIVAVITVWAFFELSKGAILWAVIFFGLGAICAWRFCTIDYSQDPKE